MIHCDSIFRRVILTLDRCVWERGLYRRKHKVRISYGRSLRANVKSSMTHHSREQYVGPATTSSVWQPARKTGKQASDCWMLLWSMHALSCARERQGTRVREGQLGS